MPPLPAVRRPRFSRSHIPAATSVLLSPPAARRPPLVSPTSLPPPTHPSPPPSPPPLEQKTLFSPGKYDLAARRERIAMAVEVARLSRALRSAATNGTDSVEIRLTTRAPQGDDPRLQPVLSFRWNGSNVSMVQDLPISRPFAADALDDVYRTVCASIPCGYYADVWPQLQPLQSLLERVPSSAEVVSMTLSRWGNVRLDCSSLHLRLEAEARGLEIFPDDAARRAPDNLGEGATALDDAEAGSVDVRTRHLTRAFAGAMATRHLSKAGGGAANSQQAARAGSETVLPQPTQLLLGIGPEGGSIHLLLIYRDMSAACRVDQSVSLEFHLPIRVRD